MKIGIATFGLFSCRQSEKAIYEKVSKIGYDGLDFSLYAKHCTPNEIFLSDRKVWQKYYLEKRAMIEDLGLKVFQTHATFPSNYDGNERISEHCLDQMKREIEATALLGSKYVVIHPINLAFGDYRKEDDFAFNMEFYTKLSDTLNEFDVYLGIENMFEFDTDKRLYVSTGCSLPQDVNKYVESANKMANSDRYVSCLDTGHMNIHSYPPEKAIREIGEKIKLLHVNDNFGYGDYHNAIGIGSINWNEVAKALKDINYKGVLSLELKPSYSLSCVDSESFWKYIEYAYFSAKNFAKPIEE